MLRTVHEPDRKQSKLVGSRPFAREQPPRSFLVIGHQGPLALVIYHIDVCQGDATLLISPTGRTLLIDGGDNGKGVEKILPLLNQLQIEALDYIVATHYDADHIGGLDEVIHGLAAGTVGLVYDRGPLPVPDMPQGDRYREYVAAVKDRRRTVAPGHRFHIFTCFDGSHVGTDHSYRPQRHDDP